MTTNEVVCIFIILAIAFLLDEGYIATMNQGIVAGAIVGCVWGYLLFSKRYH